MTRDLLKDRPDLRLVADMVDTHTRVLDIGCGDGALLRFLREKSHVDARGIELSQLGVNACVQRGLPVVQGDADHDLVDYPTNAFDYVILSQTLQAMQRPKIVLEQMLRIGKYAILSFPNFGHWRIRAHLTLKGRMPVTQSLPSSWHETPNIHFCTINDFRDLIMEMKVKVEKGIVLTHSGNPLPEHSPWWIWNLLGEQAIFLLKR